MKREHFCGRTPILLRLTSALARSIAVRVGLGRMLRWQGLASPPTPALSSSPILLHLHIELTDRLWIVKLSFGPRIHRRLSPYYLLIQWNKESPFDAIVFNRNATASSLTRLSAKRASSHRQPINPLVVVAAVYPPSPSIVTISTSNGHCWRTLAWPHAARHCASLRPHASA